MNFGACAWAQAPQPQLEHFTGPVAVMAVAQ